MIVLLQTPSRPPALFCKTRLQALCFLSTFVINADGRLVYVASPSGGDPARNSLTGQDRNVMNMRASEMIPACLLLLSDLSV